MYGCMYARSILISTNILSAWVSYFLLLLLFFVWFLLILLILAKLLKMRHLDKLNACRDVYVDVHMDWYG